MKRDFLLKGVWIHVNELNIPMRAQRAQIVSKEPQIMLLKGSFVLLNIFDFETILLISLMKQILSQNTLNKF